MFVAAAVFAGTGCADIAGLEDHKPYPGMPDSPSIQCSDGTKFVSCDSVGATLPQDGNTLISAPSYRLSGNDIVDDVTGLSWHKSIGKAQSHENARFHCETTPGEYRLPTRLELATLLDYSGRYPLYIDQSVFVEATPDLYWTDTVDNDAANSYLAIDFNPNSQAEFQIFDHYEGTAARALCVRKDTTSFIVGSFDVSGQENLFLRDARTGLMWTRTIRQESGAWKAASQACRDAPEGGYHDLRLPNLKELLTIIDDSIAHADTISSFEPFKVTSGFSFWSSTPSANPKNFFTLSVKGGSVKRLPAIENGLTTLCVRGPD